MKEIFHITSDQSVSETMNAITKLPTTGRFEVIIKQTARGRTSLQNRALHLYLTMMASAFNDAGMDQQIVIGKFKEGFSIPVTMEFLKEVFKVILAGMYDKKSTADLTTTEIMDVYETFNRGMGEKYGISLPWPHEEKK